MAVNHNTYMMPCDLLERIRKDRKSMARLRVCLIEEQMTHTAQAHKSAGLY